MFAGRTLIEKIGAAGGFVQLLRRHHLVEAFGGARRARDADDMHAERLQQLADGDADDADTDDDCGLAVKKALSAGPRRAPSVLGQTPASRPTPIIRKTTVSRIGAP